MGVKVGSGGKLSSCAPSSNPCRAAMNLYHGGEDKWGNRYSWDPLNDLPCFQVAYADSLTNALPAMVHLEARVARTNLVPGCRYLVAGISTRAILINFN